MKIYEIFENKNLGLTIFDIDETLFRTTAQIKVVKNGQVIKSLTNQEFNTYELKPGEDFDFGEFRDAEKFNRESIPIEPMIAKLKAILKNAGDSKVIMLTARSDFDNKELFLATFEKYGIDTNRIHVHRAGNLGGAPAENKEVFIRKYLDTGDYARVRLYDDSMANIRMFNALSKEYPDIQFFPYFVTHEGGIKTIREDGRIVKGVNTTVDVGPNEIKTQAAKFGNTVDKDGRPPTLSKKVKGASTNVAFNLGLTESLEEDIAWQNSVSKHIFDFEGDEFSDQEEKFLLPISSSVISRLGVEEVRTTVFHVTGYKNLDAMVKNQGTKKALSTFFHMDPGTFGSGVMGGGGLVFELDANVLVAAPEDIETRVDKSGGRWIKMEFMVRNENGINTSGLYDDVPKLLAALLKKYTGKSYSIEDDDIYGDWKKLGKSLNSKGDGKTLNVLIKDFYDGVYEIYQKYSDDLVKLFRSHLSDRSPMDDTNSWDEIIVNDYKIKKIHILDTVTLKKNPQVIDRVRDTGIEYDLWQKPSKLGSHIRSISDKEKKDYIDKQPKDKQSTPTSNFNFVKPKNGLWDESRIFNLATAGKVDLGDAISKLSPQDQEWAKLRWQQNLTMKDIGAKYNLTNSQALQQYKPIHDKIRQNLGISESIFYSLVDLEENFADGKKKGKSRPGRVKRSGASCNGSVTALRKRAKNSSGEKARMYHWCANMKSGRKKS